MGEIVRIGLAQIRSGVNKDKNNEQIVQMIKKAAEQKVDILVFPEAAQVSFEAALKDEAEPLEGSFATLIRSYAVKYDMMIIAGMFEPANDGRIRNKLIITGKNTEATYQKVHLYDAFGSRESDLVEAGSDYLVLDTVFGKIGFAICYDLRFADQFTAMGKKGAKLIIVPASWGDGPGKAEQWDLLVRARAADSEAWLVACDQAWQPPKGTAPLGIGQSSIVDPTGSVRARLASEAEFMVFDIDLGKVEAIRARIPIL
ncbi:nitrilase-related carbon-nitrogen hydrolase [Bartonella apihabitans]|uniref:nitrilase-related carbon-nitrogen hydrolase n=1 Tax=uncultured Bartonella sp. TaxID=104108 RepID=UPI0025ECDDCD|nr:nitrilase-related carbon-nitrogen hydrolase [Bartonella apihabitans]WLT08873.1 nitrilase-related carbon-nitrogen hydrolase [Bartonella apihabitans]